MCCNIIEDMVAQSVVLRFKCILTQTHDGINRFFKDLQAYIKSGLSLWAVTG